MTEILLLAIVTYLTIITVGYWMNRHLRMPWMFTVVLLGFILSATGLFQETMQGDIFLFLAKMGMLFFLFTIGIDLEFDKIRKLGWHIAIGDILLTLTEGFILALLFFFAFPQFVSHSFLIALIAGIAFGTVGEVILLAILEEFGIASTKFGQLALGIGVFDDIFEIGALAVIVALPSIMSQNGSLAYHSSLVILLTLLGIFAATYLLSKFGKFLEKPIEKIPDNSFVFPFSIFLVMFSFLYFSSLGNENLGVVAAIFSGIAIQGLFFPKKLVQQYKKPIYFVGNMFLGPYFFLSLGSKISFDSLLTYPLLILAIIFISLTVRVVISYLLFQKVLGKKPA
ncbi:MAG: cation:proton antiporter, partial [Candidatus Gottesmanbacteria bacterium]|nr:cation:proton antiporter [Candidatus Gottesmanbacteria bacterium]